VTLAVAGPFRGQGMDDGMVTPYYQDGAVTLYHGDCLECLPTLEPESVDSVVTDPPAGIAFMGQSWDSNRGGRDRWIEWLAAVMRECLRVTKPGGHALVWALPRTSHWTATAIEDAGWEIEEKLVHLFGSGFPKGRHKLKPAAEDWILARKGIGPLQIDACRLPTDENRGRTRGTFPHSDDAWGNGHLARTESHPAGRWPANVVLDEEAAALLDAQSGERVSGASVTGSESSRPCPNGIYGERGRVPGHAYRDTGGASRFFPVFTADGQDDTRFRYVPKASRRERGEGNDHPTVKSLALIRWLTRLITPPGGLVCDPFAGSGTGALAARLEGFRWTGCELLEKHCAIAVRRLERTPAALPLEPEAVTP
jgi:hypothetical protein